MSTSTSDIVTSVSKGLTLFVGLPILIAGVIGGCFNVIVFLSLKTFRQSSCAFFLTIMSFVNIDQLLTSLLSRILISGFNINLTEISLEYCKFRSYCLQVCALTSFTCMCLATIDQFLATSLRPRWQQYLTLRKAHLLCTIFFIVWLLHGIPTLIWHSPVYTVRTETISCTTTNPMYQKYYTYGYTSVLIGPIPIIITVLFGSLAYRNVRQIPYRTIPLVRGELDKQLTSMVLIQVVHNVFVVVPYVTTLFIGNVANITTQSPNYLEVALSTTTAVMIYYLYFASPFYIYVCISKRFHQQFMYVLIGIYLKKHKKSVAIGINQIIPENIISHI